MITPGKALGWTRGLRFRLALSYVVFFSVLLVLLGMLFRQVLSGTFQNQMESVLDEEWGAAKGYLRTGPEGPDWIFDEKDPDESFAVRRVQRVYMLADTAVLRNLQIPGCRSSGSDSRRPSVRQASHSRAHGPQRRSLYDPVRPVGGS